MRRHPPQRSSGLGWLLLVILAIWLASQAAPVGATGPAPTGSPRAAKAVAYALAQQGKPYSWGDEGPGAFDCSGLTWAAWRNAGLDWPRMTAADQYQWLAARGRTVRRGQLRPGDLVFYGAPVHHVALYVGHGRMVEAPYSGARVRMRALRISDWAGAARPGGRG